jgi:hypothetical protein
MCHYAIFPIHPTLLYYVVTLRTMRHRHDSHVLCA